VKAKEKFDVETDAKPARLMEALRHMGHNMNSVVADLVDNSIDSGASEVRIYLEGEKGDDSPLDKLSKLRVADNGRGMDEDDMVDALCLGGGKKHRATDLGRFGMGLTVSSLGVGRRIDVMSKRSNGEALQATQDYDHIQAVDQFVSAMHEATPEESVDFETFLPPRAKSGTLVTVSRFDSLSRLRSGKKKKGPSTVAAFANHINVHLGRVFQHFIEQDELKIFINDTEIEAADPQMMGLVKARRPISLKRDVTTLDPQQTYILLDKDFEFEDPCGKNLPPVRIVVTAASLFPPVGYPKLRKLDAGFDVYRNNRLIAGSQRIALPPSPHHEHSMVRGAIFFTGGTPANPGYDKAFTVQINKNHIVLEEWLEDQIAEAVEEAVEFAMTFRKYARKYKIEDGKKTDTGITPGATAGKGITAKLGKPATKRRKTTVRKHTRVIAPGAAGALVDEDEEVSIPSGIKFQNARTLAAKEACRITRDRSGQLTVRLNPNNEYSEWVKTVLEQVAAGL